MGGSVTSHKKQQKKLQKENILKNYKSSSSSGSGTVDVVL